MKENYSYMLLRLMEYSLINLKELLCEFCPTQIYWCNLYPILLDNVLLASINFLNIEHF